MKIGYARISTHEQNLDMQIDALTKAGCGRIITDKLNGSITDRPGLEELFKYLRDGDTVVVWRLDRLGRSLKHLLSLINTFHEMNVKFVCLQEAIDTSTTTGQLFFQIFGALAEFERNLIRERTLAGLKAARARGRLGGRPKKLNESKRAIAVSLYNNREHTVKQICAMANVSAPTLYKYIKEKE